MNNYLDVINVVGFDITQIIPETIKKRTLQYLTDCDFITNWFMDLYEKTDEQTDILQLKDLYDAFKCGEVFSNMSKKDKRTYNKSYFTEKIQNNIILKYYYKDREQRKEIVELYGKKGLYQIIWGFKMKPQDEEDYGEDDE